MTRDTAQKVRRAWTPEEEALLTSAYDGTKAAKVKLRKMLNRSAASIDQKIQKMGLCRKQMPERSQWQPEEKELVFDMAGDSSPEQILKALNRWRRKNGMSDRSPNSLSRFMDRYGISRQIQSADKFALNEIARALRCSPSVVSGWVKQYRLKHEKMVDGYYIHRRILKRFWRENPGVLQALHPDMVWLVTILTAPDRDS